jgi:hypothetical protein
MLRSGRVVIFAGGVLIVACSTSSSSNNTPSFSISAAVTGAPDTHCNKKPTQTTSQASCHPDAAAPTADASTDGGAADGGTDDGGTVNPYGNTMYGAEGDDDDCKYHLKWASTSIAQNSDVTFQVTATRKTDNQPATAAKPRLEVYLNDTHPAPNTKQAPTETSPGTYSVGPIRFDASGQWTVRFHLYEDCGDLLGDSPHGHAAFFVNVP